MMGPRQKPLCCFSPTIESEATTVFEPIIYDSITNHNATAGGKFIPSNYLLTTYAYPKFRLDGVDDYISSDEGFINSYLNGKTTATIALAIDGDSVGHVFATDEAGTPFSLEMLATGGLRFMFTTSGGVSIAGLFTYDFTSLYGPTMIIIEIDTTADSADRVKIYVNGKRLTLSMYVPPALDSTITSSSSAVFNVGTNYNKSSYSKMGLYCFSIIVADPIDHSILTAGLLVPFNITSLLNAIGVSVSIVLSAYYSTYYYENTSDETYSTKIVSPDGTKYLNCTIGPLGDYTSPYDSLSAFNSRVALYNTMFSCGANMLRLDSTSGGAETRGNVLSTLWMSGNDDSPAGFYLDVSFNINTYDFPSGEKVMLFGGEGPNGEPVSLFIDEDKNLIANIRLKSIAGEYETITLSTADISPTADTMQDFQDGHKYIASIVVSVLDNTSVYFHLVIYHLNDQFITARDWREYTITIGGYVFKRDNDYNRSKLLIGGSPYYAIPSGVTVDYETITGASTHPHVIYPSDITYAVNVSTVAQTEVNLEDAVSLGYSPTFFICRFDDRSVGYSTQLTKCYGERLTEDDFIIDKPAGASFVVSDYDELGHRSLVFKPEYWPLNMHHRGNSYGAIRSNASINAIPSEIGFYLSVAVNGSSSEMLIYQIKGDVGDVSIYATASSSIEVRATDPTNGTVTLCTITEAEHSSSWVFMCINISGLFGTKIQYCVMPSTESATVVEDSTVFDLWDSDLQIYIFSDDTFTSFADDTVYVGPTQSAYAYGVTDEQFLSVVSGDTTTYDFSALERE